MIQESSKGACGLLAVLHLLKWKSGWLPTGDRTALVGSPTGSVDLRMEATLQAMGTPELRPWPGRTLTSSQMDLFLIRCGKFLNLGCGMIFAPLRKRAGGPAGSN